MFNVGDVVRLNPCLEWREGGVNSFSRGVVYKIDHSERFGCYYGVEWERSGDFMRSWWREEELQLDKNHLILKRLGYAV